MRTQGGYVIFWKLTFFDTSAKLTAVKIVAKTRQSNDKWSTSAGKVEKNVETGLATW